MLSVTVYSTGPACMRCKMTKDKLEAKGVHVDVVELAENPAAREYVTEELGYSEAPVVVVEDGTGQDHWCGFRPDQINRVAAAAA
ncbi:glutaredoxin domain-containing protein [Isoptericola nanjingensis]|uniref:glutaredoxin domain-containing protein n=1 Tax=Isoptericola TaxID=254250 RepID=UPI003D1EDC28|nr:glutaredoxin family protein [Isoptericola sp. QY 916]